MGRGKKKGGQQQQQEKAEASSPQETHAAPDSGDTPETTATSRKDKRAAKKAAMKQTQQTGDDSSSLAAQPTFAEQRQSASSHTGSFASGPASSVPSTASPISSPVDYPEMGYGGGHYGDGYRGRGRGGRRGSGERGRGRGSPTESFTSTPPAEVQSAASSMPYSPDSPPGVEYGSGYGGGGGSDRGRGGYRGGGDRGGHGGGGDRGGRGGDRGGRGGDRGGRGGYGDRGRGGYGDRGRGRGRGRGDAVTEYERSPGQFGAQPSGDDRRNFQQPDSGHESPQSFQGQGRGRGRGKQPGTPQQYYQSEDNYPPVGGARPKQPTFQSTTSLPLQAPADKPIQSPQQGGAHAAQPFQQSPKDVSTVTDKMKNLALATFNIPVRPELNKGGTEGRRTIVETNHLPLDLSRLKNKTCVHYDVDIQPERPKRLYRAAVEAFRLKNFPNRYPAFDGRKNLVASSFLPNLVEGQQLSDTVKVKDDEKENEKEFKVTIKCVNIVDLTCLTRYMQDGSNLDLPQMAIQMLDIVIRSAPSQRFVQVGRSFFTQPERIQELGNGMHMWLGFYQSVILGWKPFLNVDVAHKGFPAPKNVKDIISDLFNTYHNTIDLSRELNKYQENDLSAFLKGLKVEYKLPNQPSTKRTFRVNSARSCAASISFKGPDGKQITIADYFRREKNYVLQYPKLPCLHVGSLNRENPIYLPVELCTILPGQVTFKKMNENQTSAMIKYAATSTDIRKGKINTAIQNARYNNDPTIKEFGIFISDKFQTVEARVLTAPALQDRRENVQPIRGVWRTNGFLRGSRLNTWYIVNYGVYIRRDDLRNFATELERNGNRLGMSIQPHQDIMMIEKYPNVNLFHQTLDQLKRAQAELVIVIIDDKRGIYAEVKRAAELQIGLVTQCIKKRTVSRADPATVSNILLKINSKLNGVNHKLSPPVRPPCLHRPAMIVGADVTHPSPDQRTIPSVAAVCASHDPDAFQYNFEYRLQPPRQEIIQDLRAIMKKQLMFFFQRTRFKPERIIFYRDGVSEGMFSMVLNEELRQIKAACASLNESYQPKITFLVVQKRHHTRFFPINREDEDGKNKNVPAGTIVDTTITHPRHIDFYLVSHASIQGVSRPTKYRTLWDDSDMSVNELEQLTYYLCHLFSRCTRSVSYPAPTYYAHLAAYRARTYIEGNPIDLDRLSEEQQSRAIRDEIVKLNPMFFV